MGYSALELVLIMLAGFRLSKLVMEDSILEFIRKPFYSYTEEDGEEYKQSKGFIGDLLSCYWCFPVWATIILVVLYHFFPAIMGIIIVILACSAGASFIYTIYDKTLRR